MKYFTLSELTKTNTRLDNTPPAEAVRKLETLVAKVLDPLREAYGEPIYVNSGYRSPAVNRAVGGARNSQHCKGEAVDFKCKDMAWCFLFIKNYLDFDQLIWERGTKEQPQWLHVSYRADGKNRRQVLYIGVKS